MKFASGILRRRRWRPLLAPPPCSLEGTLSFGRGHDGGFPLRHSSTESTPSPSPSPHHPPPHNLRYPDPPSTEHHDLASYAAYAARTGLDTASTTYIGTRYEYAVAASLQRLGFDLRRVGGRSDCGIDLLGIWTVPSPSPSSSSLTTPLRILLQCKASTSQATRIGPQYVRELEGAFAGAPVGWRGGGGGGGGPGVLGMLVAQKPATKGIRDALGRSRWPMGYVSCTGDGRLQQMLWNRRAEEEGLEGLGVGVRYIQTEEAGGGGRRRGRQAPDQELILTWNGRPYVRSEHNIGAAAENPPTASVETSSA